MRVLLCHCRSHLEAWEIVRTRAFEFEVHGLEYAETTADEEMVLEPY